MELATKYNPDEVEDKWYAYWMKHKMFASKPDHREPYTIVIPPPNVTGVLHMGHMLNNTIQDTLIRRARMTGKNACWVPGTDHASIATEAKVVNKLAQQGIKKTDITREEFLKHAWDWTNHHGGIILEQLKKLGASCDWDRTCFTMDEPRSKEVIRTFIDLYNKELVYRGVRMVNWDPQALTALSDEEVVYKEQQGKLYYLRYKIVGEEGCAVVATTRPETILGDTAMCINPHDPKNTHLRGKKVIVPLVNRVIPVIEDEYVDVEFGTGCLKVTPAHDVNDYMLGEKFNLEVIDIFNNNGTINDKVGMYVGMDRFDVRILIEKDLETAGLLDKTEAYTNKVGTSERTGAVIEPKLSMQWFLKMDKLVIPATEAVMNDDIRFVPAKFKNTYRHWMENIKDWCISRQLWWGHQIPAYYLPQGGYVVADSAEAALDAARLKSGNHDLELSDLRQDEDCLDTWFSSWLWPMSVFGELDNNKELDYYYPTTDLVTAPDIIFFWVARMIMAGYEYKGGLPFKNVYFTGIVRDKQGRKMSKSLGNSPDPLDLIAQYGADGVRMGIMMAAPAGNDVLFDDTLCEQGRNFNNKIWNAFRLVKGWEVDESIAQPEASAIATEWFEAQLDKVTNYADDCFSKYRLSEALTEIYKLFKDEFSSWYLEIIKPAYQCSIDRVTYDRTLEFFEALLRLLHPFMPFITEELWQAIEERAEGESLMLQQLPVVKPIDTHSAELINRFDRTKLIVSGIRTIRLSKNIPNKEFLCLEIVGEHNPEHNAAIIKLCNLDSIQIVEKMSIGSSSFLVGTTEFSVPLGNMINLEGEIEKLNKELVYQKGFMKSVLAKLSNEKFVTNAPASVIEAERKKLSDAEQKIHSLNEAISGLK